MTGFDGFVQAGAAELTIIVATLLREALITAVHGKGYLSRGAWGHASPSICSGRLLCFQFQGSGISESLTQKTRMLCVQHEARSCLDIFQARRLGPRDTPTTVEGHRGAGHAELQTSQVWSRDGQI